MAKIRKRRWLRNPLTEHEESVEGKSYYGDKDRAAILATFKPRDAFDSDVFFRRLESAAWWYVNLSAAKDEPVKSASVAERRWQTLSGLAEKLRSALTKFVGAEAASPPSLMARKWATLAKQSERLFEQLTTLSASEYSDLFEAMDQIARRNGALPDFEPERSVLPPLSNAEKEEAISPGYVTLWPVEAQFDTSLGVLVWLAERLAAAAHGSSNSKSSKSSKSSDAISTVNEQTRSALENLAWLVAALKECENLASKEKMPGRHADEPNHIFVRLVDSLYNESALEPRNPGKNATAVGSERGREKQTPEPEGEIIELLLAALKPLGVPGSRNSIYKTWQRAAYNVPRPDKPWLRGLWGRERRTKRTKVR
jgi:hypothetical protein